MFDDSFNHEAWHDGTQTRINLILDLWHPELTDPEVKFFEMLLKSKLKGDKFMSDKIDNQDHLYSIIEKTKDLIKTNDDWWINWLNINNCLTSREWLHCAEQLVRCRLTSFCRLVVANRFVYEPFVFRKLSCHLEVFYKSFTGTKSYLF